MQPLRLSPKRFIAVVSAIFTLYSTARVGVLFFEALSVVRTERAEDYELLEICQRGDARGSTKMREACLKARAELASPVIFKAVVHAVSVAFKDFSDTVGSPLKLFVCVLFVISSVMLPIVPWARALFGTPVSEPTAMNGVHYISYAPPRDLRGKLRRRVGNAMKKLKLRSGPVIEEMDDGESGDDMEPGIQMTSTKPAAYYGADDLSALEGDGGKWMTIDVGGLGFLNRPVSPHRKVD